MATLIEKIKGLTRIDPTPISAKEIALKPGNGLDVSKGLIYIKLNENNEKTSDGQDFLYFDNKKLTINHIKDEIDKQIKNVCFGGEDRCSKGYIEMGIAICEAKINDLFLSAQYGEYSPYPAKDDAEKRYVPGIATVEDTTNYVDGRLNYMANEIHSNMVDELSKKADADNVDQTIRAEFLGAYGFTLFDLEGKKRSVILEHESIDGQHYVNVNAEDKSGYVKLVMPNNGETKTFMYAEDASTEIASLNERIQELESQIAEIKRNLHVLDKVGAKALIDLHNKTQK